VLLGTRSCPIVDCSRSFASLIISPQGDRDATINMRAPREMLRRTTLQPHTSTTRLSSRPPAAAPYAATVPSILATRPCRGMRVRVITRAPCTYGQLKHVSRSTRSRPGSTTSLQSLKRARTATV